MRKRFVIATCAAFLFLLGASAAYSTEYFDYGSGTYSPGEQHGSSYDCPYFNAVWDLNGFAKTATRLGKAIFIDNSGHWIAVAEDATTYTLLNRPDLSAIKKGSVKNTSAYTYSGHGEVGSNSSCV